MSITTKSASAAPLANGSTLRQRMDRCTELIGQLQPPTEGVSRCHVSPVVTKEEAMEPGSLRRRHTRCMELIAQFKATMDD